MGYVNQVGGQVAVVITCQCGASQEVLFNFPTDMSEDKLMYAARDIATTEHGWAMHPGSATDQRLRGTFNVICDRCVAAIKNEDSARREAFTEAFDALLQHLKADTVGRIYIDLKNCPNSDGFVWETFYPALHDHLNTVCDNSDVREFRAAGQVRMKELNMRPGIPMDTLPWGRS